MNKETRELSKSYTTTTHRSSEAIDTGSLKRIADALELIAEKLVLLERKNKKPIDLSSGNGGMVGH